MTENKKIKIEKRITDSIHRSRSRKAEVREHKMFSLLTQQTPSIEKDGLVASSSSKPTQKKDRKE